ncbi:helix-turn-helix domain-containing protein [Amycolatopsis lexingtonensis]|uniref:helix-turn-helix domain-containing protein n=1 Tax=Amycolatopsis lexingtonensis TaxID=218822 RepID=UPI000A3AAFB4|nr:helix-turn-helix domain-containing protein [Amycolatopsis lexingtonensis]
MSRESALETLGETMRHLRTANGASLTAAALAAGVSKGHLSNVERGRDSPSWDLIDFYEEAYGGDGQLWSAYVETVAGPRQRRPQVTHPAYPIAGDESAFVADVTVPDGTVMPPGFRFEKVWRLRNAGTVPWIGRYLRRLGAPGGLGIPSSPVRVRITAPGPLLPRHLHDHRGRRPSPAPEPPAARARLSPKPTDPRPAGLTGGPGESGGGGI